MREIDSLLDDLSGNSRRGTPDTREDFMAHVWPRIFRLSADHGCSPIWELRGRDYVNIDLDALELSPELAARLAHWMATFEATYQRDQPENSGFSSEDSANDFDEKGRRLADALEVELGDARVIYLLRGRVKRAPP